MEKKEIMDNYFASPKEVLDFLKVDEENGLSEIEVEKLLLQYGKNKLVEEKSKSLLAIFFSQLNNGLIYVLLAAVAITIYVGEYVDATIILIVIFINAIIGTVQENKANHSIEALKKLATPHAIVKRDGTVKEISAEDLVPGDIVILETGRYIPADLKLIEGVNLKIDESLLTGESVPSSKDPFIKFETTNVGIGDRKDLAFMSTLVTYGRGTGVVIKTGMNTEIGKIAKSIDSEKESSTPLEIKMNDLGKNLGILAIVICAIIFVIAAFQGRSISENFLNAVSLAVASIPEGLAAIVAIVLSIGVTKMSKENAIVKKLYSVESLGSVNIICSDKTGTLTLNKMTVSHYFTKKEAGEIVRHKENKVSKDVKMMALGMSLCNDSTYKDGEVSGDPTELALLYFAEDVGLENKEKLYQKYERIGEFPFDSDRKLMSTLHKDGDKYKVFTKGAVDNLLNICTHTLIDGEEVELTDDLKAEYMAQIDELSNHALRTLGLAYKDSDKELKASEMENNLIFVGIVGMIDPPRTVVKKAISEAKSAGINTIMITGDYKNTAFAIGKKLGIVKSIDEVITGQELEKMSEKELMEHVDKYRVYARVSPEHKVKIVKALQSHKNMVAMIGDGVNDAPSLSAANIGVSMGTGTDVAKGAAEIILTDDNFGTIVTAINSGRNIYNNIKKSIVFLLSSNLGEIISIFVSTIIGFWVIGWRDLAILSATQLLWVNLLTDSLPAIALGMEKGDDDVMKEKPRKEGEGFFAGGTLTQILIVGTIIGLSTIVAFAIGYSKNLGEEYARTMAFLTLVAGQLFYSFSLRNDHKTVLKLGLFSNIYLVGAVLISVLLQIAIILIPFFREAFGLQIISLRDLAIVIGLGSIPFIVMEIRKMFLKKK